MGKNCRIVSLIILLSIFSCDSANVSQIAFVTDVRVDPAAVHLNDLASVEVDFEPSQDQDFVDPDGSPTLSATDVVIKLPPGIDYVTDSSEFDGSDVHGFEKRNPNTVEICSDGTRALSYHFSAGELTDNENSIRIFVKPYEGSGAVIFLAEADDFISIPCAVVSGQTDTLILLP